MEEREAKAAKKAPLNMFDPDDDEFVKRYNRSRHTSSGKGKGNVVKVSRDSFKDVTDKMTKQATADDFRQRFGSSKSGSSSRRTAPTDTSGINDEDELDALISKISVEGKPYSHLIATYANLASQKQRRDRISQIQGTARLQSNRRSQITSTETIWTMITG